MAVLKNNIRKILFSKMSQVSIDRFYNIYYCLKYPSEMSKRKSYGELNPNITYYVIRPRIDGTEGLMSLFMNVTKNIHFAAEHGFEPIVDFKNYHTQYSDIVDGETNAWNFYFTQPIEKELEEVYQSKNVILSGLENQWYRPDLFNKSYDDENLRKLHDFIFSNIGFSNYINEATNREIVDLDLDREHTLGLYLRGTDYVTLKPSGHPVQPTVEQAIKIIEQYRNKYPIDKIFLVTEDGNIYNKIKGRFGDDCVVVSYDTFVTNYDGKNFLSHDKCISELSNSPYIRGVNYLVKLVILSKCSYFVGGDTMGSWAACTFSDKSYVSKYVFDLGLYGK